MSGKDIVSGLIDLGVGAYVGDAISEEVGGGIVGMAAGFVGGSVAAGAAQVALNKIDRETGIVSDLGDVVDDIFSIF